MSSEKVAENSGSATENLSSNYSAKQKDANAPEAHEIKYVLEVHHLQKKLLPSLCVRNWVFQEKKKSSFESCCIASLY